MFNRIKINQLQNKILNNGDYDTQLKKSVEELNELLVELQHFMFLNTGGPVTHKDLCKPCGNMQKEIEDVKQIMKQVEKMFNRTPDQRKMSKICRKRIVKQMQKFIKERGMR